MITLKITPDEGPSYNVTATARDVMAWEKTTGRTKSFVDLINDPTLVDLYRVAHLACWRQGLIPNGMTQKQFEDSCEVSGQLDDEDDEVDAEPDPTLPDPSTEPSSPSPSEPASPRPSGRKKANEQ